MNAPMINMDSRRTNSSCGDQSITSSYPHVRNEQRNVLLECLEIRPAMWVLDVHSEDGPVCDELKRRHQHAGIETVCLLSEATQRLQPGQPGFSDPIEMFFSIPSASVDAALSLAALRGSKAQMRTLEETYRVLKQGGQFAFCDVEEGSRFADWLQNFVLPNTPQAQKPQFLAPGNAMAMMQRAGFRDVVEVSLNVPLIFPDIGAMSHYFHLLFAMTCDVADVSASLLDCLQINTARTNGWRFLEVACPMVYCSGRK